MRSLVSILIIGLVAPASAEDPRHYGLSPASIFRQLEVDVGAGVGSGLAPAAGLWYFDGEWVAVPRPATVRDDSLPPIVWIAAPELVEDIRLLEPDSIRLADGTEMSFETVPPFPHNDLYVDASTIAFFRNRTLRLRGATTESGGERAFVARTIWPEDAAIPWTDLDVEPIEAPETLGDLIQAQAPRWPSARLLWERRAEAGRHWAGRPVLALVLSGAQADAPKAQAGHIAVATGQLGPDGGWADWLVNNIYPLDTVGHKRISSGPVTMDNYLTDLNSGQALYRPVYVAAALLSDPEAAAIVQAEFDELFVRYWCHEVVFEPSRHNSTEMSVDVLREVGWRVPRVGGTSWVKGLLSALGVLVATQRPKLARHTWDYFTVERTDLFPRVAFETAVNDLLGLLDETARRALSPFERRLHDDTDALLFLRFPQIPSRRPFGTYPVASTQGYRTRVMIGETELEEPEPRDPSFPERLRKLCRRDGTR